VIKLSNLDFHFPKQIFREIETALHLFYRVRFVSLFYVILFVLSLGTY